MIEVGNLPKRGVVARHDVAKGAALAVVQLTYRGRQVSPPPGCQAIEIECEVYQDPESNTLMVHSVCPKCRHGIKIDGRNKAIDYRADRGLFIEPFTCTWEMSDDRQEFGIGLCQMTVAYDGRVIKDA